MSTYRIGVVSRKLDLSVDTLRYYEKIGLLPSVARNGAGIRFYTERDISRLRFIRRAQSMNFTLNEIGELLRFREDPAGAKPFVRQMALKKLSAIEGQIEALKALRNELRPLVDRCAESKDCCPIIEDIDR
ncbi:MAG: heavy metal-responsive transcriptional regulator [Methylococcaceae bacterium]|nr:heavy metal-responsive transcriptional regulator [Methylococcaceae bacterium]